MAVPHTGCHPKSPPSLASDSALCWLCLSYCRPQPFIPPTILHSLPGAPAPRLQEYSLPYPTPSFLPTVPQRRRHLPAAAPLSPLGAFHPRLVMVCSVGVRNSVEGYIRGRFLSTIPKSRSRVPCVARTVIPFKY